jgi:D-arginine dehydrogenase
VDALTYAAGVFHARTPGGDFSAPKLVLAGGAWSAALGALAGAPLPVTALRRHLALLEAPDGGAGPGADDAVVWRLEAGREVYYRPESGGALASPCDEEVWEPGDGEVPTDTAALAKLGELLGDFAPTLGQARVRRAWGCLRTFAPDREFVAGADERLPGLYWCAGLGGRGMTCGLALGELVAASVLGTPHPLHHALRPSRLFGAPPTRGGGAPASGQA